MIDLQATDVRMFLPSRDFALSQAFYEALGCEREWADDNLALFKLGPSRFYLQRGYAKEWAENTMLHVAVQDAAACFNAIRALLDTGKYPGARVALPRSEPYGAQVTYVWDPAGVLLHLAQWDAKD
ncbi:glyoxalase [Stenotrophomonas sp. NPDC078853]|uniref:glyoxalase n=1 Tax=Stenotrophomonas sp. NPDC078853 TaxID=3364534 RepID=UPI00384B2E12